MSDLYCYGYAAGHKASNAMHARAAKKFKYVPNPLRT